MPNPRCRNTSCRRRFEIDPHRNAENQFYCSRPCAQEHRLRLKRKRKKPVFKTVPGYTGKSSLSDQEKLEVRERYWLLGDTQIAIARDLKVSYQTVRRALAAGAPPFATGMFKVWEDCPGCGAKFKPDRSKANAYESNQLYCTHKCMERINSRRKHARARARKAAQPPVLIKCKHCGRPFPKYRTRVYCTPDCAKLAKQELHKLARRKDAHV